MERNQEETWSLAELAEKAGLSPRTIRYYISRGLLDGPAVAGRGAVYTTGHLNRLREIQDLQSKGAMLAQITRLLGGGRSETPGPSAEPWFRYQLDDDVVVMVRGDLAPWRIREIRKALDTFAANIKRKDENASDERKS
jgi:DNA-binding transcriptional MerR regulator